MSRRDQVRAGVTALVLLLAVVGLTALDHERIGRTNAPAARPPSIDAVVLDHDRIALHEGRARFQGDQLMLLPEIAESDLDGDGRADTAGVLREQSVGTGVFYYLAIRLAGDRGRPAKAFFLGDRITSVALTAANGTVRVSFLSRTAATSFSGAVDQRTRIAVRLINGSLTAVSWRDRPLAGSG